MDGILYHEHDHLEAVHWWFLGRQAICRVILTQFLRNHDLNRKILDIGCGTGEMLKLLREFGSVIGMDMSPYAVERAKQKTGCQVEHGSFPTSVPFSPETFETITAFDVLEHLQDDQAAMQHIHNLLRPEGFLIVTVPAFQFLWSSHDDLNQHKRRYTREELCNKLERVGFQVQRVTYFNSFLFPAIWIARLVGRLLGWKGSNLAVPTFGLNKILTSLLNLEARALSFISFPIGTSLIAVGKKGNKTF